MFKFQLYKWFWLLCFTCCFFGAEAYADKPLVGILKTVQEMYPNELTYAEKSDELLEKFGAEVMLIDYNKIANDSDDIVEGVKAFVRKNGIKKVLIPGNYYNIDQPPYAPNTNRALASKGLAELMVNDEIRVLAVCGGLQSMMDSVGVEIKRMSDAMISSHFSTVNPFVGDDIYRDFYSMLHVVKVNPRSKLAKIMDVDDVLKDDNGWIRLYILDLHSEAIAKNEKNLYKMHEKGYNITGVDERDGGIEIVEDNKGNFFFQCHPDAMVMIDTSKLAISQQVDSSIKAMKNLINYFINES